MPCKLLPQVTERQGSETLLGAEHMFSATSASVTGLKTVGFESVLKKTPSINRVEVKSSKSFSATGVAPAIADVIRDDENDEVDVNAPGALACNRAKENLPVPDVPHVPPDGTSTMGAPKRTSLL